MFAGLLFLTIAAAFAAEGTNYPMGSLRQMGPGYVPVALSVLLASLGVLIGAIGFLRPDTAEPSRIPWRAILLITVSIVVFGALARPLGLVPCVFLCGLMLALASERNGILAAFAIGGSLALVCFLIFKQGLAIALPTFGPLTAPLVATITGS